MRSFGRLLRHSRAGTLVLLALLPIVASACGTDDTPEPCPQVVRIVDASRLVKYQGPGRDLTDVWFEAELADLQLVCEYDDEVVEAELAVTFRVTSGPADKERLAVLRYFVAIATTGQEVVAHEEFELTVPFEGNSTGLLAIDELEPRIPLRSGQTGADYKVYVGFSLTPDEMRFNRESLR